MGTIRPRSGSSLIAIAFLLAAVTASSGDEPTPSGALERTLLAEGPDALLRDALTQGDAQNGALLFHRAALMCTKCHTVGERDGGTLGPDLASWKQPPTAEHLVDAVLRPSKAIREGFVPVTVATKDGKVVTGLVVEDPGGEVSLRTSDPLAPPVKIPADQIEDRALASTSIMPAGLVNALATRREFLDLLRYLSEVSEGGPARARELAPPAWALAPRALPAYESDLDHAGLIRGSEDEGLARGRTIYERMCINCHGTTERPGSIPSARRFASEPLKNGADPLSLYRTLTHGFGLMEPQGLLVPSQKYDVIHYLREAFFRPLNPSQYVTVDEAYLAGLPEGASRGPEPLSIEPWVTMDYGPSLMATYEVGHDGSNLAFKGIAVRLDPGPGGVSQGRRWMLYEHDTMRVAAAWSGQGFIDWRGVNFDGAHEAHPRIVGDVHLANPAGPGWADPESGRFNDPRPLARDGRPYGPFPRSWMKYRGVYRHGSRTILSYTVGETPILESPGLEEHSGGPVFTRTFRVGPRAGERVLRVASHPAGSGLKILGREGKGFVAIGAEDRGDRSPKPWEFDGSTSALVDHPDDFDMTHRDFTITARVRTREGGAIFSKAGPDDTWAPDAKALFVQRGRLVFDIGWVGEVRGRTPIDDDRPHDVAMTWEHESGKVRLYIDGRLDAEGVLRPKGDPKGQVVRLGAAAKDFPEPRAGFVGSIEHLRFFDRKLPPDEIAQLDRGSATPAPLADWRFGGDSGSRVRDQAEHGHDARLSGTTGPSRQLPWLVAGLASRPMGSRWEVAEGGDLRLRLPAGDEPLIFTVWTAGASGPDEARRIAESRVDQEAPIDLAGFTEGGPSLWPNPVEARTEFGSSDGPFAVDILEVPAANPWSCLVRPSGFDFLPGGDRAAVSTWDGDVWIVSGLRDPSGKLAWRRIASGLFQPLGVKVVDGTIYVGCRDQIVILRDRNGDGETDFYECFNDDHQVTEHFHEFAMDLQTDPSGNFYYTKAARHALPALVPQHGTLLRVSRDGNRTDILATGFRAPNGVCLNPDGTFFITDQEGHWTPKNRVNWVRTGRFYGNFMGFTDVTDPSDDAMEPPVCWITNAFDRSPAQILRVDSEAWGPLKGGLLNISYGYGKVFAVLHEMVGDLMQGGMVALPIPSFPTGIIRGRFHPDDGQLYLCGLYAWAGSQQSPGGFYRIRPTGKPLRLPIGLEARRGGVRLTFTEPLDPAGASDRSRFAVRVWGLARTENYGSKHIDEHDLDVASVRVSSDHRVVDLEIPDLTPTRGMEIRYRLRSADGEPIEGVIHNTIHRLPDGSR
jgi:putative heme-binding domain-containing protein